MAGKNSTALAVVAVLLSVCAAALAARETARGRVALVPAEEQRSLFGGTFFYCRYTATSCPGTTGCILKGMMCVQCKQTLVSWQACKTTNNSSLNCDEVYNNPGAFCGTTFYGTPKMGVCSTCDKESGGCAKQVPNTVFGDPCF